MNDNQELRQELEVEGEIVEKEDRKEWLEIIKQSKEVIKDKRIVDLGEIMENIKGGFKKWEVGKEIIK